MRRPHILIFAVAIRFALGAILVLLIVPDAERAAEFFGQRRPAEQAVGSVTGSGTGSFRSGRRSRGNQRSRHVIRCYSSGSGSAAKSARTG